MAVKWVAFDLGGVLFRIRASWSLAADSLGIDRPDLHRSIFVTPEFAAYQEGLIEEHLYAAALGKALDLSPQTALEVHDAILVEPYPDSDRLVLDLKTVGLQTACLSNTNHRHWQRLIDPTYFPAMASLDLPFASHLVQLSKPGEAIYREFEAQTQASKDEIVYFDDLRENVGAGMALGWQAFLVDPASPIEQMRSILEELGLLPLKREA